MEISVGKDILNFNNFKAFDWRAMASPQFLSPQSPKINCQTFRLIFLALFIRTNERKAVTSKHVTSKPKWV